MSRRVVITGAGCVTPLGVDIASVWQKLVAGESGVGPITLFDAEGFPVRIAAEAKQWDPTRLSAYDPDYAQQARQTQFALSAAIDAANSSGLDGMDLDPSRVGLFMGCGEIFPDFCDFGHAVGRSLRDGGLEVEAFLQATKQSCPPLADSIFDPGSAVASVARYLNAQGPSANFTTACVSSSKAIGESAEVIRRGDADIVYAGGAHSMIHPFGISGFHRLSTLTTHNDDPEGASRPFDRERDGFVVGEGGVLVVLEELEHAKARGADIWGEFTGFGTAHDAFRITDPHPLGRAAARAVSQALEDAHINAEEVDYINAHGSSTIANDMMETRAIKLAFGNFAHSVPISSTKSMTGHLTTACGAIEFLFSLLAVRFNVIPPTINYGNVDPECDLDYVPNHCREIQCDHAVSNSFGFGGQNVALVVSTFR